MTHRRRLRPLAAVTTALLAAGALAACGSDDADDGRTRVVTAFYPMQFVAERVGGDDVRVDSLVKPGADSHDLELSPRQVGQISDADLILYLSEFQPAVDEAVTSEGGDRALDVGTLVPLLDGAAGGHEHDEHGHEADGHDHAHDQARDPHLWLDPARMATITDRVADRLAETDPANAADYRARAAALRTDLQTLDQEYEAGLRSCERRELVVSHTAFGYLTERFGLEQIGVSGLTPEDEPTPQRLAEATEEARAHGATTIYFESLVSPKVAETIAREVGATTAVLDPLEAAPAEGDYLSAMRANLAALRTGQGCA
ncbi:metal ABC transporter substrate-binding protein [Melissospora conviva]|uniref:metal ABC transporter substrate-binding protein n=1 Tax=Melissospora conviva TaxID=3388432 RepID=UPI003C1B58F0